MKTTTTIIEEVAVEKTDDIKCNQCGHSIVVDKDHDSITGGTAEIYFGYGSKRDTEKHKFHLCDDCADNLIGSFVYPPDVTEEF